MSDDRKTRDEPPQTKNDSGDRQVNVKAIVIVLSFCLVAGLVIHFSLAGLFIIFRKSFNRAEHRFADNRADTSIKTPNQFPEPRLQLAPREDLTALLAREETELTSFGWIDRTNGIVRIPIDHAIDLVLQRGLPVRGTNDTPRRISPLQLQQNRAEQK